MKTITLITPCFNEEENVADCYNAVRDIFRDRLSGYRREHIFCDNASTDRTVAILKEIAAKDRDVKIIVNARNFGPQRSTYNGVLAGTGDAVLLFVPADLQDPPELIPDFVKHWEAGVEVVYGIRAERNESLISRWIRKIYYRLISKLSYISVPPDVGDFQLVDRKVVDAMRQIDDAYPFMRIMTFECGFSSLGIPYKWQRRRKGFSKNRLSNLFDQGMNGIITFTNAPLRLALFMGFILASLSLLYAGATFIMDLFFRGFAPPGIPTLIVALFFFGGIQVFFLGLLGEYILAIYGQVRRKPLVFERERINF